MEGGAARAGIVEGMMPADSFTDRQQTHSKLMAGTISCTLILERNEVDILALSWFSPKVKF